jgi:hypothetical protein
VLQGSIDQSLFGNFGIQRTLRDEPLGASGDGILLLLDVIYPAPFAYGFFAPGKTVSN